MASLGKLPAETVLQALRNLGIRDLAAVAATCRWLYALANPMLYKLDVQNPESYAFYDAARSGHIGRMQKLVNAGFDVNQTWFSPFSGPRFEEIKIMDVWRKGGCEKEAVILHRQVASERRAQATKTRYQSAHQEIPSLEWDSGQVAELDSEANRFDFEEDKTNSNSSRFLGASRRPQDVENHCYWTALHVAAANGQDEAVSFLIDRGADINAPSKGCCECVQIRADIRGSNGIGHHPLLWSPLHIAICRGHVSATRQLLIRGASTFVEVDSLGEPKFQPNSDNMADPISQGRCTALHVACYYGVHSIVMSLIEGEYQSDLEVEDRLGQTPFVYAFLAKQFDAIIPYLHRKGCNINITLGQTRASCLIMACMVYQYDDAIKLVELGVDVNSLNFTAENPLHLCTYSCPSRDKRIEKKRYELAHKLLEAGTSLTCENDCKHTPLFSAALRLDIHMIEIFIQHGADVSDRNTVGNTALSCICRFRADITWDTYSEQRFTAMVGLLISPKVDINERDDRHSTALHNACDTYKPSPYVHTFLKTLIDHGASITLRNRSGLLPFHAAFLDGAAFLDDCLDVCLVLFDEQVKALLTKDDITDMFLALLSLPKDLTPALFNLLLDAGGGFLLTQPSILKMALDSRASSLLPLLVHKTTFENFVSNSGETVIHRGCQSGMFERRAVIPQLLESGVEFDGDITNQDGETLLYTYCVAAQKRAWITPSHSIIINLLERGANPHKIVKQISSDCYPDYSQCERPLDIVISGCQFDLAEKILERSHIQSSSSGCSYLHRSCSFQMAPASVKLTCHFLKLGFDPNGISCFGETPLFHMLHTFQPGLPSEYSPYSGRKPFMAVEHVDRLMECILILENYGAKWNVRNKYSWSDRWTPIDELRHLLSYNGEHRRSQYELSRLREHFMHKKWDVEDVGENFSLFERE
ncbi:ankyrin [Xylaria telfairii]|nr:ankyrin [Xylaria telfairii]